MKILIPSYQYKDYKIIRLKRYFDDKSVYYVTDKENRKKLLFQYKFYNVNEINAKCKTIGLISKLTIKNFLSYEDFFVEVEEIEYHSFFYLNVICNPAKTLNLVDILKCFQKKVGSKIEEVIIWNVLQLIISSIYLAYQNEIFLENFDLSKIFFKLPIRKMKEEKTEMAIKLMKLLAKGFKTNTEILFFNKISQAKRTKNILYKKNYLAKIIEKKPILFDFICFREISSNNLQVSTSETNLFKEISKFFLTMLSILCKNSFEEFIGKGSQSIEQSIENLEYSFHLKSLFKKACIFNNNLPRSLNHILSCVGYYHQNFKEMASISKSLSLRENKEFYFKLLKNISPMLYYIHKDFLILIELKPKEIKTPNLLILNIKTLKPREISDFFVKSLVWNQKNLFYIIFEKPMKKDEMDKIYKLEIDFLDIQSKIQENPYIYLEDLSNNQNFSIEEFVSLKHNFCVFEMIIEKEEYIKISGFDSVKNKIQFYTLNLKTKDLFLIKETSSISLNMKIIDFWNYGNEIWFWKRVTLKNFQKDILEVHNVEKNQVFTIEIDKKTYEEILLQEKIQALDGLEFYSRPFIFQDLKKIMVFVKVDKKIKILLGNLDGFSKVYFINSEQNLTNFMNSNNFSNHFVMNDREIFMISGQDDEIFLDFYELDENLKVFNHENTKKMWGLKSKIFGEMNNFMGDFLFNQYKIKKFNEIAENFEIMDENRGKMIMIFKRKISLKQNSFNVSSRTLIFHDIKFFFDLNFHEKIKKIIYVPEAFYFTSNVAEHKFEIWLFYEKNEKNLFEYLHDFRDNRSYDSLRIFNSILKKFMKFKEYNLIFNENLTLENIFIIYNHKKKKQEFKFDFLTQQEKERISYYFIYFQGQNDSEKKTKVPSSDFLRKIENNDLKKFGLMLFFIYFPRFLQKSEINFTHIEKMITKTKSELKFYDKDVINLLENLILSEKSSITSLSDLCSIVKEIHNYKASDMIGSALRYHNIFSIETKSESNLQKDIFFIENQYPLLMKYNFYSKEIKKAMIFFKKNQRYNLNNVIVYCADYQKHVIFAFGEHPLEKTLIFFSINVEFESDQYLLNLLPNNNLSIYDTRQDFQPTRLIYLKDFVYQIGGELKYFQTIKGCNDCYRYNVTYKKWFAMSKLNISRRRPGIVTSKHHIFVFGGAEETELEKFGSKGKICIEKYHPDLDKWEQIFIRNLDKEYFDFFYKNMKFIKCLDSEKTFLILNLQMNKCFIIFLQKEEGELFETKVAEPQNLLKVLEAKKLLFVEDSWFNDKMIVMNKNAQMTFVENGEIYHLQIKEKEHEFTIYWDSEVSVWNLV